MYHDCINVEPHTNELTLIFDDNNDNIIRQSISQNENEKIQQWKIDQLNSVHEKEKQMKKSNPR
jgi:hypothetical protein